DGEGRRERPRRLGQRRAGQAEREEAGAAQERRGVMAAGASFRIASAGRLGKAKPVRFSFDGQSHEGCEGDTLASALLANGIHLMGRSFKYHRPRGVLSSGAEEPNALVGIHRDEARKTPNVRATAQELYDGLTAVSQNRWPSLSFDLGAINSLAAPLFSAGFYYKTFMWPRVAWEKLYEPAIR